MAVSDSDVVVLLEGVPCGDYLLECRDGWRILWRLTDGEPPDGALEPAEAWALSDGALLPA
jgi:hypothetical protein